MSFLLRYWFDLVDHIHPLNQLLNFLKVLSNIENNHFLAYSTKLEFITFLNMLNYNLGKSLKLII